MRKYRVVHYVNQFFGQIGGEDKASEPPSVVPGPVGPGRLLDRALDGTGEVVATVICGDNYFATDIERVSREVLALIKAQGPDAVVAGPAFDAGRYGLACGAVVVAVQEQLGLPAVTGMYVEQAAVLAYRSRTIILSTGRSAREMGSAMGGLTRLLLKQLRGEPIGTPEEEGYIPRGIRRNRRHSAPAAARMVDMLLAKLDGQSLETEIPMPEIVPVEPSPPIQDLPKAVIALVTTGGLVPRGNPDSLRSQASGRYGRYSLVGMDRLAAGDFEANHAGYYHEFVNQDPNRMVPLDALRELEREGRIGGVYETLYTLAGSGTQATKARDFAASIAQELKERAVSGVILTST